MKLGRGTRVVIATTNEEKEKIELAAFIRKTSVAAYAREVLLKDADNVIKKASKK